VAQEHVVGEGVGRGGFELTHGHQAHLGRLRKASGSSEVGPAIDHRNMPAERSGQVHQRLGVVAGAIHHQAQWWPQHFERGAHWASLGDNSENLGLPLRQCGAGSLG
jgi:hypothetical protein